jgi:hypothetical protein
VEEKVRAGKGQHLFSVNQEVLVLEARSHPVYLVHEFDPFLFQLKLASFFVIGPLELTQQATAQPEFELFFGHQLADLLEAERAWAVLCGELVDELELGEEELD